LIAYLLLHRESAHSRQRLAFLLWPDSAESQARANLRKLLFDLHRLLSEMLTDIYNHLKQLGAMITPPQK
jgi:DNA-binding SARP family transcriptional activator